MKLMKGLVVIESLELQRLKLESWGDTKIKSLML